MNKPEYLDNPKDEETISGKIFLLENKFVEVTTIWDKVLKGKLTYYGQRRHGPITLIIECEPDVVQYIDQVKVKDIKEIQPYF